MASKLPRCAHCGTDATKAAKLAHFAHCGTDAAKAAKLACCAHCGRDATMVSELAHCAHAMLAGLGEPGQGAAFDSVSAINMGMRNEPDLQLHSSMRACAAKSGHVRCVFLACDLDAEMFNSSTAARELVQPSPGASGARA
eukprot:1160076-Pelagomonas_calceolata.AAC.7